MMVKVTSTLRLLMTLLWLPAVALAALEPCKEADVSDLPFCNMSLPIPERVRDLISRMTLQEKVSQMDNQAASIDRLHIDYYQWSTEALHGISGTCTPDGRCPTSYPAPVGIGATFNLELVKTMATQISSEARRMFTENHLNAGGNNTWQWIGLDFWAPNINLFRDPRWGRGMETPGEDPYLNGEYAVAYIRAMQEGEDPRYLKTVATLKHYAAYSLENWKGNSRFSFDAIVSDRDLAQSYLPAFEAGIKKGKAESVMCSYNAVNGIPACANSFLLQDILRNEWNWDGYVVSDCGAIKSVFDAHKYKPTKEEAASVSLKAGTDLDCGTFYSNLENATNTGLVSSDDIDRALARLFTARFKLGMFDPWEQQPYLQYPPETLGHPDHVATALAIGRESIVLLKNAGGFLPLDANSMKSIAVLGPHYNSTKELCGNYFRDLPHIDSPFQVVQDRFPGTVTGIKGCDVNSKSTDDFEMATNAASSADVALLFMGINKDIENEGNDREEIGLPGTQEQFIEAVAQVQSNTVLILLNGGSLDISAAKNNVHVVAILEAFYPGMKGGEAIADVLFGDYNPSGRLPYTMHKKDFVDRIPMSDMSMTHYPGRTYRYFRGETVYPFGFGLSYTTFAYATLGITHDPDSSLNNGPTYRVLVTNTGPVSGDTSVLAFISYKESSDDYKCPQSQLFGVRKIHDLQPGQSKEIFFSAAATALKCYHKTNQVLGAPDGWYTFQIGDSIQHEFFSSASGMS